VAAPRGDPNPPEARNAVVSAGAESLTSVQIAPSAIKKVPFITSSRCAETREEGAHRIDVKGDEHRPLAHIVRSTQKLLGDYKIEHAARHEHEVLAGHFGIGVVARDEEDRDQARQILKAHNGHFINFYGRWTTEYMDP
jgi:hypothetical protein